MAAMTIIGHVEGVNFQSIEKETKEISDTLARSFPSVSHICWSLWKANAIV